MCHWAPCQWGAVGLLYRRGGGGLGGRSLATGQRREVGHVLLSDGVESQWRGRTWKGWNPEKVRAPSPFHPPPTPHPITLYDSPISSSALIVMCQHILPSGLTNKTALIQQPGLVDKRRLAKTSNQIGNVWREAHKNDFYRSFLLLVHSPMLFTIHLFIALAFTRLGDGTPGALIRC